MTNNMPTKSIEYNRIRWIYIDAVNASTLDFLKKEFNFHHLDLDDIQNINQTAKIDSYKNYLFLILQLPHWDAQTKSILSHQIGVFIGDGYVITVDQQKGKELKNLFYTCLKNKRTQREWMSQDPGFLLYNIVNALFHTTRPVLNNIGKHISDIETDIFSGDQDTKTIKSLATHRRSVLAFRRILDPERYVVANLSHTRKTFLNEQVSLYFDDVADYLNKLWAILDTYKDTIDGLHVTVESLINQRTNNVIRALTVISVSLLPLTLLSGIYGMNIDELPYAENPIQVWMMFGILAVIIVVTIAVMKKRKWL